MMVFPVSHWSSPAEDGGGTPLPAPLVYWPFNNSKNDAIHGLSAGTGTMAYTTGKFNNAARIDPSSVFYSDVFTIYLPSSFGAWSTSFWTKFDANTYGWGIQFYGTNDQVALFNGGGGYLQFMSNVDNNYYPGAGDDSSHLVVLTAASGTLSLYVDNILQSTCAYIDSGSFAQWSFNTGQDFGGSGTHYIDDLTLWNVALNSTQRSYLWNGGTGRTAQ